MPYTGPVPQTWVDQLARHVSKNDMGGRVLAEQLCRDNWDAIAALFAGAKLTGEQARLIPVSVITGARVTAADVGAKEG